jgi:hypothetical protein
MQRDDKDYAIEFGRHLVVAARAFMDAHNNAEMAREKDEEQDGDALTDAWRGLSSAIYEFEKRAARVDGGKW